jgi:hypothetical protein
MLSKLFLLGASFQTLVNLAPATTATVQVFPCVAPTTCTGLYEITVAINGQPTLTIVGTPPNATFPTGAFPTASTTIVGNPKP